MKKTLTLCGAIVGTVFIFSMLNGCKNEPKQEDPQEVAEEQNEAKLEVAEDIKDDSGYLVEAAATDLMEIEIGKLAQKKGISPEVKKFGKMLEDDHRTADAENKELAATKNIAIPNVITEEGQQEYDKLNEKTGSDFDKKFADMMVDGHEKAINKMRKASEDAEDADIRNWATSKIVSLSEHLEHAKALKDRLD